MRHVLLRGHAGFALPVTIVLAGICALLIAVAYKTVNDGSRAVRAYLDQSRCRLAAQTAMDVFVEKLHDTLDRTVWCDASGAESPQYMEEVNTIYSKFFSGTGGMCASLASVVADFNQREAVALSGLGSTNANSWVARLGGGRKDEQTDIQISLLTPNLEKDVKLYTDKGGYNQYAEVTLRMQATARMPRGTGQTTGYGATSVIEQKVRFGALGFGSRPGNYAGDVYALPARCFESAINADCPLVFGTCAGNSGWTINGEVRTRGFVYCGNKDRATARIHGELHVAARPAGVSVMPYASEFVVGRENFRCYSVARRDNVGGLCKECVNGRNSYMRFPSPGRRTGYQPVTGSPEWYGYEPVRPDPGDTSNAAYSGVFKGGYAVWQAVEAAGGAPVCYTNAMAEWFHIPILENTKKKGAWTKGGVIQLQLNKNSKPEVLGRYPNGTDVTFELPSGPRWSSTTTTSEPLVLIGSYLHPITFKGPVFWSGDVIIGGFVTGHGAICSGRNIHIVRDIVMKTPPVWRQDANYDDAAHLENAKADMVALLACGNIVIGNYLDATANTYDNVTGFKQKVQKVTMPLESDPKLLCGYNGWRQDVKLPTDSPIGPNPFKGDYFANWKGRPIFEPYRPDDGYGHSVTNLCRPVVRIDAMLCSANAIVGVIGPGDFVAAQSDLERKAATTEDAVGYGSVSGGVGIRSGHGMQLRRDPVRREISDYLMTPGTVFMLNGGLVCRDLALYLDYAQNVNLGDGAWTPERVKAIINWDDRYMADSEDANYLTRKVVNRVTDLSGHPVQNPLELPTDASPKPQILSWREVSDGVTEVAW